MRSKLAIGGAVVALASVTLVAQAATSSGGGTSQTNCQTSSWEQSAVAATSKFRPVAALRTNVTAIYPVKVTVSGVLKGKPAVIRVMDRWVNLAEVAKPGPILVRPVNGRPTPFSFTWTAPGGSAAEHGHQFDVSWRRATNTGTSTLVKADIVVTYTYGACSGG